MSAESLGSVGSSLCSRFFWAPVCVLWRCVSLAGGEDSFPAGRPVCGEGRKLLKCDISLNFKMQPNQGRKINGVRENGAEREH